MKWRTYKRAITGTTRTFLVLPLVETDMTGGKNNNNQQTGLRLFTKTWKKDGTEENQRPLTATLEKPQVLDIRLIGKIDMSLIKKEFLSISNLCRVQVPTINRTRPRRKTAVLERRRPLSNLPVASERLKLPKKPQQETTSEDDEDSALKKPPRSKIRPPAIITTKKLEIPRPEEINNNFKIRKRSTKSSSSTDSNSESIKHHSPVLVVPEPCTTCGRPDQPERFHSHPTTPLKPLKRAPEPKVEVKQTVQKPVAIRYKSRIEPVPQRQKVEEERMALPVQKLVHTPPKDEDGKKVVKGPRTLTCYICGREFGTASLPLHEPKCLQRWERENSSLPSSIQKKAPVRPDGQMSKDDWNKYAWEAAQAALVPCQNCGRTFFPDRLMVHKRSCKVPQRGAVAMMKSNEAPKTPVPTPKTVQCSVCGKLFGTKSIRIHEPQCLRKWHLQNDHLPPDQREPFATEPKRDSQAAKDQSPPKQSVEEERPPSSKRPPMMPCYICGRLFGVSSINIHEPQCLKKWKIENEKLPPNKRRPEPAKPDIVFTQDGKIDFQATEEVKWQTHLQQLVPCQLCGRTFTPDRVEVHERSCKGPNAN